MDTPDTPRRTLRVNLLDLGEAFENTSGEIAYYLDLESGEVVGITAETWDELERINAVVYTDSGEVLVPFAEALERHDVPQWMGPLLEEAGQVEAGLGSRYVELPRASAGDDYEDMELFIESVQDERLQDRLKWAIEGRGAFGRFRSSLASEPREQDRWYAFKSARVRERAIEWLREEAGVEPLTD